MIDIIIVYTYILLILYVVIRPLNADDNLGDAASILLIALPAYSYHLLCEVFGGGQSLGKKLVGIKVIDIRGNEASLTQYFIRWAFRLFDMVITLGAGAVLSAALSKNSQRIGDMLAGTIIIDQRGKTDISETIYFEMQDEHYQPLFPQVMHLSDRDINGIRNLLNTKSKSSDTEAYIEQVADRIKDVLSLKSDLPSGMFLEQLLIDYNFLTQQGS